jgi:hypothetical protein
LPEAAHEGTKTKSQTPARAASMTPPDREFKFILQRYELAAKVIGI